MAKLLIFHQGALGDFAAVFPAILRLRENFPQIAVICQSSLGKLACSLDVATQCFPSESAIFASLYSDRPDIRVRHLLRAYDEIILFSYSESLKRTVSQVNKNVCLIFPRPDVSQQIHITAHILSNLIRCGLLKADEPVPASDRDRRDKDFDSKKILLHPGSGSKRKNWDISNFKRVGEILASDGKRIEFILGPAEYSMADMLKKDDPDRIVHRISDLPELLSLLRTAGGFIGNDSGMSHLAAFLGLPTVAVFGPSDPQRWKPSGRSAAAVRPDNLDCRPCFETNSENCRNIECLNRTSPENVVRAFYELIPISLSKSDVAHAPCSEPGA